MRFKNNSRDTASLALIGLALVTPPSWTNHCSQESRDRNALIDQLGDGVGPEGENPQELSPWG